MQRCSVIIPGSLKPYYAHQVIELPKIHMDVSHFILSKGTCCHFRKTVKAAIPREHRTGYGPRLSALIAEISGIQGNSRETVRSFCESVLNMSISTGAIQKVIDRVSTALKPYYEAIGEKARNSDINHVDETSWFKNGVLHWLWVMTNCNVAYFMIHKNRSKIAFLELIQEWQGILVSDNYGTYKKWVYLRQTCLAHLIRRAKGISVGRTNTLFQADLSDAVVTIFSITCGGSGFVFQRAKTRFILDIIKVVTPVNMYIYFTLCPSIN